MIEGLMVSWLILGTKEEDEPVIKDTLSHLESICKVGKKVKVIYFTSKAWGVVAQSPEPEAHDKSV